MHEGLRLVEVVEEEETGRDESKDDGKVIRDQVVGDSHGGGTLRVSGRQQCVDGGGNGGVVWWKGGGEGLSSWSGAAGSRGEAAEWPVCVGEGVGAAYV